MKTDRIREIRRSGKANRFEITELADMSLRYQEIVDPACPLNKRKVFTCTGCQHAVLDEQPSSCDCMEEGAHYVESTLLEVSPHAK